MGRNAWFKVYDRMIDSPQVLELNDTEFRLLVSSWCLASSQEQRGTLPYTARALQRRVLPDHPVGEVEEMLAHLVALELLTPPDEQGHYRIVNWDKHQYDYASWAPGARASQKRSERAAAAAAAAVERDVASMSQARRKDVATQTQARRNPVASGRKTEEEEEEDVDEEEDVEGEAVSLSRVLSVDVDLSPPQQSSSKTRASARDGGGSSDETSPEGELAELTLRVAKAAHWDEGTYDGSELAATLDRYVEYFSGDQLAAFAIVAREWHTEKRRKLTLRTLDSWLQREVKSWATAKQKTAAAVAAAVAATQQKGSGRRIVEPDWTNDGPWAAAVEESQRRLAAAADEQRAAREREEAQTHDDEADDDEQTPPHCPDCGGELEPDALDARFSWCRPCSKLVDLAVPA